MDVDVHQLAGHREHQHAGGELPHHQRPPVTLFQRDPAGAGAGVPAVDEKVFHRPVRTGRRRAADKAADPDPAGGIVDRQHPLGEIPPEDGVDRPHQVAVAGGAVDLLAVPDEGEGDLRVGEGDFVDDRGHRPRLGRVLFEELKPGRDVIEDVPHDDRRPVGAAGVRDAGHLRAAHLHQRPGGRPFHLGHHLDVGDGGDGRQRLPPEPQRPDRIEVGGVPHLAGRVAHKGLRGVLPLDAAAVVGHPQVFDPAVLDFDGDGGGTGVDRVFDQLLDDRSRPFDNLPGGDQLGHFPGEDVYLRHSGFLSIRNEK